MNEEIMKKQGFCEFLISIKEGKCPFCKKQVDVNEFTDEKSLREYKISGLCKKCQYGFFDK